MVLVDYKSVTIAVESAVHICNRNFSGVNFDFTVVTAPSRGKTHFCEDGHGNSFCSQGTVDDRLEGCLGRLQPTGRRDEAGALLMAPWEESAWEAQCSL